MKASPGTGIVSSVVLESDVLDEIDWEWLGGDTKQVQTNFFGKGNTTTYDRGGFSDVSSPQDTFHTYTVDWTSERIQWIINGNVVRTLTYDDPTTLGGKNYPQTPMRVKLGSWCGGCSSSEGTVQWAGGKTSFDNAPYVMYIQSVDITNYNPAEAYEYSDKTGSYQSIKLINDGSSSSPSGGSGSSSASATASATGASDSTATTAKSTQTVAPTSSHMVDPASKNTDDVVQSKTEAASGSTGTAAAGSGNCTTGCTGMATSVVSATTQVPQQSGSFPTGTGSAGTGSGYGSSGNASVTSSGPSASSSFPAQNTNGAVAASMMTGGSLLTLVLGSLLL